jgi:hypothetical protein
VIVGCLIGFHAFLDGEFNAASGAFDQGFSLVVLVAGVQLTAARTSSRLARAITLFMVIILSFWSISSKLSDRRCI